MQWFGKPVNFNRFLGQVDQDDPTNLPIGLAALCRNTDFTRESPGVTCASTRAGNNLAMQLVSSTGRPSALPGTGAIFFAYEPQLPSDAALFPPAGFFQMVLALEAGGCLQREYPAGSGRMQKLVTDARVSIPAGSHMIGAPAGNKVWAALSNLVTPTGQGLCIDPRGISTGAGAAAVNPIGMKPVGWYWQANTACLAMEVACPAAPSTGNGHTYQAQNAGVTGPNQPVWPLTEGGIVVETLSAAQIALGLTPVTWKEKTMVLANRLPAPSQPVLHVGGGGTFAAGLDVYVILSLVNAQGQSLTSLAAIIANTLLNASVTATLPTLASMAGWIQTLASQYVPTGCDIYVATVATGTPAPPTSAYELFGTTQALGAVVVITGPGTGAAPPTACTARVVPGQLPTPDVQVEVTRNPGAGTFPAGRDVYITQTYTNPVGETKAGPSNAIINTVLDDGVQVTVAVPEDENEEALYSISSVGIYEADVPTGTPAPPLSAFNLVGYYAAGATPTVTESAAGQNPPTANTTGPGGAIVADTSTGGANGGQGFRYAALLWMNQNETVSGFTIASLAQYDVDEDGWEIGVFNILTGPVNVVARPVAFTGADSSQDGPFNWSGLINLLVPAVNVVYPMTTLVDSVAQSATAIFDNVTTQATFNFTDTFMDSENNVDDRTDILAPVQACRIDYLKTVNCLAYSGVLGYSGGGLISIGGDPESIYADTGPLPFPSDGQKCFGFTDAYKSVIFALREEGGYAVQPNTGNPSSWDVVQRWSDVGPCGFRAWDANGKFIIFAHRSGLYKYDEADPDMMSKEIPRKWSTINWAAAAGICVTIDEDTHTVRLQVPTGQSTVNNEEFCLSYLEGWQNPIHFSTFSGKEISMDAARRWSFNDIAATLCVRMNRTLPAGPGFIDGPDWTTQPDSSFGVSQLLFVSSGFDGAIHARTPGVYSDNGAGIDWQWESVCAGMMQAVCKPEGVNLNVLGHGQIYWCFLAARDQDAGPGGAIGNEIPIGDGWFELDSGQRIGITGKCEPSINEYFRVRFTNNKVAGAWCSLKQMNVYLIPFTVGRGSWETNR